MRVGLVAYDSAWPLRYERERERIAGALGDAAERIEHIGSTSVPGLIAKPIVDILVATRDVRDERVRAALERAGYVLRVDELEHRMFRTPGCDVHVHLWPAFSPDIDRHVLLRDWLRSHPKDRALYEHVKRVLAQREWREQNDYAQAKSPVIASILRRARGGGEGPRVERFAALLLERLGAGAAVLEIGAGEGQLAVRLASAGCDVTALEPGLRSIYPVVETTFERYDADGRCFDCIAAQLVLHHVDDLEATLARIEAMLVPGGIVAIDDYGWERSDDPAFRADRADLHTSAAMLAALRRNFRETFYRDNAHLSEGAGTDAIGFTFLGTLQTQ